MLYSSVEQSELDSYTAHHSPQQLFCVILTLSKVFQSSAPPHSSVSSVFSNYCSSILSVSSVSHQYCAVVLHAYGIIVAVTTIDDALYLSKSPSQSRSVPSVSQYCTIIYGIVAVTFGSLRPLCFQSSVESSQVAATFKEER